MGEIKRGAIGVFMGDDASPATLWIFTGSFFLDLALFRRIDETGKALRAEPLDQFWPLIDADHAPL